jgi:hypothetical protein
MVVVGRARGSRRGSRRICDRSALESHSDYPIRWLCDTFHCETSRKCEPSNTRLLLSRFRRLFGAACRFCLCWEMTSLLLFEQTPPKFRALSKDKHRVSLRHQKNTTASYQRLKWVYLDRKRSRQWFLFDVPSPSDSFTRHATQERDRILYDHCTTSARIHAPECSARYVLF